MAGNRVITPRASRPSELPLLSASAVLPPPATGVQLSAADYAELMRELVGRVRVLRVLDVTRSGNAAKAA